MASLNTAQIIDRAREVLGRGISDQEAQQIMNATGGGDEGQVYSYLRSYGGGGGGNTASEFIKALVDPILKELGDYEKRVKEFGLEGPFAFDEALARESAKEIVDPYYDQLLSEFIGGIEMERKQGVVNERELLDSLTKEKEYELGDYRRKLEDAIASTEAGYELKGLFTSGLRKRATGAQETAGEAGIQRAEDIFGQREQGVKRETQNLLDQLGYKQQVGTRELETGRREEIESGVEQRRKEAQQQTEIERLQATALPFVDRTEDLMQRLLQYA